MSVALKQGIWTPEKRLEQARVLRGRQIWLKSTGPRTAEGKAKSSMNACKPGYEERQNGKRVRNYVRLHRLFLNIYMSGRREWHLMPMAAKQSLFQRLAILKNELGILYVKIMKFMDQPSNVIRFPEKPPS